MARISPYIVDLRKRVSESISRVPLKIKKKRSTGKEESSDLGISGLTAILVTFASWGLAALFYFWENYFGTAAFALIGLVAIIFFFKRP